MNKRIINITSLKPDHQIDPEFEGACKATALIQALEEEDDIVVDFDQVISASVAEIFENIDGFRAVEEDIPEEFLSMLNDDMSPGDIERAKETMKQSEAFKHRRLPSIQLGFSKKPINVHNYFVS